MRDHPVLRKLAIQILIGHLDPATRVSRIRRRLMLKPQAAGVSNLDHARMTWGGGLERSSPLSVAFANGRNWLTFCVFMLGLLAALVFALHWRRTK